MKRNISSAVSWIVWGAASFATSFYVTLFFIDHSDFGPGSYSRPVGPCAGPRTVLKRPFQHETGFAVQVALPQFKEFADGSEFPSKSNLVLCENNAALGPSHSQHNDVRTKGLGRYSNWNDYLLFSSSDNSDPQTNRREYSVRSP